jgi:hypothetical protein
MAIAILIIKTHERRTGMKNFFEKNRPSDIDRCFDDLLFEGRDPLTLETLKSLLKMTGSKIAVPENYTWGELFVLSTSWLVEQTPDTSSMLEEGAIKNMAEIAKMYNF